MNNIVLAGIACTALAFAPTASADVPGLAPFVGQWYGMRESVVIDSSGNGHFHYMDFNLCPSCSMADTKYSTVDYTLTSVSNGTASGSVTASSDTQGYTIGGSSGVLGVGKPVTTKLSPKSSGETLQLTIGGVGEGMFCTAANAHQCGD